MAHNTLYKVGSRSHTIEVVYGFRSCDGDTAACRANLTAGGWGTDAPGDEQTIGNRNVSILNNLIYNPAPYSSLYQQLAIYGPQTPGPGSNIPAPSRTDDQLIIRGNLFWNGGPSMPIGIEDSDQGCRPGNPTCNETQLRADNWFNQIEPDLRSPAAGDLRPAEGSAVFSLPAAALLPFPGGDRPAPPLAPAGLLSNEVARDYTGAARGGSNPPGAYAGPIRPRAAADGYLGWNGFLEMINVLELGNSASLPLTVTATVFDGTGAAAGQRSVVIPAKGQFDLIINDMPGFHRDSYGLVTLDYSGSELRARMSYYRAARQPGQFDFAFALPLTQPSTGETFVSFNTYQPSRSPQDAALPVFNWLSIVNFDPVAPHTFTVDRYSSAGTALGRTTVTVQPFARVDLEAGHVNPGPNSVGLLQINSDSPASPYSAFLVRYGVASSGFAFAFPLAAKSAGSSVKFVPVSTGGGAQNWLELINTTGGAQDFDLKINDGAGRLVLSENINLAAHAQYHLDAAQALGPNVSGSARIEAAGAAANSMYYFFSPAGSIDSMYGTQATGTGASPQTGSYNLFLNMADWLKLYNGLETPITPVIRIYSQAGVTELNLTLPPRGAADLPIHQRSLTGAVPDSYGIVEIDGAVFSQILRIKPAGPERFDFVFPTELN